MCILDCLQVIIWKQIIIVNIDVVEDVKNEKKSQ